MEANESKLNKVKIKNFPTTFSSDDKRSFMTYFGAVEVVIHQDFVIGQFNCENEATLFLKTFHQKEILDKRLKVEFFTKGLEGMNEIPQSSKQGQCNNINDYFLKWVSMNSELDFNQPPPPYLRYKYPLATREIIDSICVALESVPKFYTQVLHLMNKMNLPPPFTTTDVHKRKEYESISSQTEISHVRGVKRRIWSGGQLLSDESELESDEDEVKNVPVDVSLKRKKTTTVTQNPAKRFLQIKHYPKSVKQGKDEPSSVFEMKNPIQSRKITLHVPTELTRVENLPVKVLVEPVIKTETQGKILSRADLASNRLSPEQISILPVFKNYLPGPRSNKLYIKNLAKTVTTDDLRMIYEHFTKKNNDEIEIKLMQSGRMKGQAFITFNTPYDDEDGERMIDKALQETNGFLLKDKPMVVMYGKS